jgi:hypothetical protein
MAQLLVTFEPNWYQSVASVRQYSESDFEEKVLKYGKQIFPSHHVLHCKYDIIDKTDPKEKFKPDFLLISQNFKSWTFVEVELCGKRLEHTRKQFKCFLNPDFHAEDFVDYLIRKNIEVSAHRDELLDLARNRTPKVLAIYDNFCSGTLDKIHAEFPDVLVAVVETYRTSGHPSEVYRISGEYPHDISGISLLQSLKDRQHYEVLRPELLSHIADQSDIELDYYMRIIPGKLYRSKHKQTYIKLVDNPIPPDINVELRISPSNKLILKRL